MRRTGLGRHGLIEENAGDPLDGLINLFDIGMILAVAFLIAGLGITLHAEHKRTADGRPHPRGTVLPSPSSDAPSAHGRGRAVGKVYRLPDGRLILVKHR